jgi:hypothetical protein
MAIRGNKFVYSRFVYNFNKCTTAIHAGNTNVIAHSKKINKTVNHNAIILFLKFNL